MCTSRAVADISTRTGAVLRGRCCETRNNGQPHPYGPRDAAKRQVFAFRRQGGGAARDEQNGSFRIRWMTSVGRPQGTVTLHRDLTDIHTDTFSALAGVLQIRQFWEAGADRPLWPFFWSHATSHTRLSSTSLATIHAGATPIQANIQDG